MTQLHTIYDYTKLFSKELERRILQDYPALQQFEDPISPRVRQLLRRPFPAQAIAIMGVAKRWRQQHTAGIVAECGTGKTLMSLGAIHVHADGRPFTAIAMVPPHLVEKWAREAFQILPGIRVFMVDDLRNAGDPKTPHGVNEVRLQGRRIVRKGLHTTLTDPILRHSGRPTATRYSEKRPLISSAATCMGSSTTRFATKCINLPAIRPRAMLSAPWPPVPIDWWDSPVR